MMQETTQDVELKDPMLFLPPEMLSQLLLCLSPSSIARSSAINRRWRSIINSDPSLHQEVDLSYLGRLNFRLNDTVEHLNRISILSGHKLITVTLDLTKFLYEFNTPTVSDIMYGRGRVCSNKISREFNQLLEILQESTQTLKFLNIKMDPAKSKGFSHSTTPSNGILGFISPLMRQIHLFKRLAVVEIQGPFHFSASAGQESRGSRRISFVNNIGERIHDIRQTSIPSISKYLRKMTEIAGSGLTEFRSFRKSVIEDFFEAEELLGVLVESKSTLQALEFKYFNNDSERIKSEVWNLAQSCPLLHSFGFVEGWEWQTTKPIIRQVALRNLHINFTWHAAPAEANWEPMLGWIGHQLESFTLEHHSMNTEERSLGSIDSRTLISLLNTNTSLKSLNLKNVGKVGDENLLQEGQLLLPNLNQLSINSITPSLQSLISNLNTPRLQVLQFTHEYSWVSRGHPYREEAFNCFLDVLQNCSSTLVEVKSSFHYSGITLPEHRSPIVLPALKLLSLRNLDHGTSTEAEYFLSDTFTCPSLVTLDTNLLLFKDLLNPKWKEANRKYREGLADLFKDLPPPSFT